MGWARAAGRDFRDWGALGSWWAGLGFGMLSFLLACGGDVGVWDQTDVFGVVQSVRGAHFGDIGKL